MESITDKPKFEVVGSLNPHYLIKANASGIAAWEKLKDEDNNYVTTLLRPSQVVGGKETLEKLEIWNSFSKEIKEEIEKVPAPMATIEDAPKAKASKMVLNAEGQLVKRGRGRPRKVVDPAAPVPVVDPDAPARKRGRPRKLVDSEGSERKDRSVEPVVKKIVMIKLADGTIIPRGRGRPPAGSTVIAE